MTCPTDDDLIRRGDAIAACAVGPSDEWARATKSGYMQAATDCTFNVLRIPAAVSRAPLAASLPADPATNAGCCQPVRVKPSPDEHYDDYCIRQFAKLMSEKMAASRAKGRSGWNDPERCSIEYLRSLLYEHLDKGDPVDVANFCMMLRHYEASTYREFCNCTPQPSPDVAAKVQALVDDGRPCASDLFLVALFDQINDVHDREYFIKAWLEGDWECATSEITIGAAK